MNSMSYKHIPLIWPRNSILEIDPDEIVEAQLDDKDPWLDHRNAMDLYQCPQT